jgi:hypothetical protein
MQLLMFVYYLVWSKFYPSWWLFPYTRWTSKLSILTFFKITRK